MVGGGCCFSVSLWHCREGSAGGKVVLFGRLILEGQVLVLGLVWCEGRGSKQVAVQWLCSS